MTLEPEAIQYKLRILDAGLDAFWWELNYCKGLEYSQKWFGEVPEWSNGAVSKTVVR